MSGASGKSAHLQDGPTASRPTYLLIQVLRMIAAMMVVAQHTTIMLHQRVHIGPVTWASGGAGVDIFFVISGFVMMISSAPLRSTRHPARTFLARRIERIVPLYWLMTTVKVLAVLAVPAMAINALGTPWHVLASYLFLPSGHEPVLVVGWTLEFEMMFYVLFALALWMRASIWKLLTPVLLVLGSLEFFPRLTLPGFLAGYERTLVFEFLLGIVLAIALPHLRRLPQGVGIALLLGGFAVLLGWGAPQDSLWRGVEWGPPAMAVVAGAIALERHWGKRVFRWMLELGDASYSIYLVHAFVLPVVGILAIHLAVHRIGVEAATIGVTMLLSALCGDVVYRAVERPMTRWFKGRRKTAIPANA